MLEITSDCQMTAATGISGSLRGTAAGDSNGSVVGGDTTETCNGNNRQHQLGFQI